MSDCAGPEIAIRCAEVNLGTKIPLVVLDISRIEVAFGVIVPMPTCAIQEKVKNIKIRKNFVMLNILSKILLNVFN